MKFTVLTATNRLGNFSSKVAEKYAENLKGKGFDVDLKDLINLLLTKDFKARPRIIDIINRPFVKSHMERFVKSAGKNNLNPQLGKKREI